ncbi:MBL fold metallo-hydrolase [Bacillus sp. 2205SS5-2]|uniref:MBL fold metallo-hydrolase n=1 Tax=Bacillus sp. 2205SS5-2 TaxID=3109031 RepID=UPI003006EB53
MRLLKEEFVYQVSFMPNWFPVNCYLLEEDESLTLIDAALPNSTKSIIEAAKKIGKPIKRIVLTHAHFDHVGALDSIKKLLPAVEVMISARDARLLAGDSSLDPSEPSTPVRGGVPKNIYTVPTTLLEDGDMIGSLKVIASPGHTPGSISFYDTRSGILIAGDAFQTRGGMAVSGKVKPLFPFPAMATWNKEIAVNSAKKLALIEPTLLAVGHGNMMKSPLQSMKKAISEAEKTMKVSS